MEKHFDARAATWDTPERLARTQRTADAMLPFLPQGRPRTVELGAGTGQLSRSLSAHLGHVVLLDSSAAMIEVAGRAVEEHGWEARVADVTADGIPDGPFELALAQLALHHIHDVPALFARIHAALAPGGRLLVADLDHDPEGHFHAHVEGFSGHHGFRREDIAAWLADAGFADVEFRDAGTLTKEVEGHRQDFPLFLAAATA